METNHSNNQELSAADLNSRGKIENHSHDIISQKKGMTQLPSTSDSSSVLPLTVTFASALAASLAGRKKDR